MYSKIFKWTSWILIIISVILLIWGSVTGFETNGGRAVDVLLRWGYILLFVAVAAVIIAAIAVSVKNNPKSLIKALIALGVGGRLGGGQQGDELGGHQGGNNDPELLLRWLQFGAYTPIFRTHATNDSRLERRIWKYSNFTQLREAVRLLDEETEPQNFHLQFLIGLAERLGFAIDEQAHPELVRVPATRADRQKQLRQLCSYLSENIESWQPPRSLDVLTEIFD